LNLLLDRGVNVIDTAASYAGSEEAIGKAVSHRRKDYHLISKCGQAFEELPGKAWSGELIAATVDRALRRLQTDRLDVMLLHSCDLDVLKQGEALGALVRARQAGKVRFVGYSGDNDAAAFAAQLPDVEVLETSISFLDQANIARVLPLAAEHNLGVVAKRPLANSAWRPPDELTGFYRDYAKPYHERFIRMGLKIEQFAAGAQDWAKAALAFTLSQPRVHTAIVGTTSPENALRNLEAVENASLSAEAVQRIREAFRRAEKESGEEWKALS
jgi:aryl-alcohol dehydrogenase-like predicted oxidoreductase